MGKKKKWADIGMITVNKGEKDGKKYSITKLVVNDNVTILVDGEPVKFKKYEFNNGKVEYSLNLISPIQEVESLYKAEQIDEESIDYRREAAKKAASWLKYKISAPFED